MQKTLKLKLHNALNQLNLADADSPALIVGGRRRNRKKRKSRNGTNRKRNKKGEFIDDTPAQTPESPRKTFIDHQEVSESKQSLVSCLDIEEPIFAVYPAALKNAETLDVNNSLYSSEESLNNKDLTSSSILTEETEKDLEELDNDNCTVDTYETEDRKLRHNSEDSGVFDDEEDWNKQHLVSFEDDDSALSENGFDGKDQENPTDCCESIDQSEIIPQDPVSAETGKIDAAWEEVEIDNSFEEVELSDENENNEDSSALVKEKAPEILSADFSEVEPFLTKFEEPDDREDVIFDLAELQEKPLKLCHEDDDISPRRDNNTFQLMSSLYEPTELEDEVPHRISLDLLSDDEDDVVLFEAGGRKELSIVCNPLYEQSLKEDTDAASVRSFQQGFKTDFDNINLIRLPATDKAAQKEIKESSPLISKTPADEIACCVIL